MITKKTKKQKEMDNQRIQKAYKKLYIKANRFVGEIYDIEFDIQYMNVGTVSGMMESVRVVNEALTVQKEEYVFTDFLLDREKKEWDNSTSIRHYKNQND